MVEEVISSLLGLDSMWLYIMHRPESPRRGWGSLSSSSSSSSLSRVPNFWKPIFLANWIGISIANMRISPMKRTNWQRCHLTRSPPSPGGLTDGLPRNDRWSRWSAGVGVYHRTNKLLFHVGQSFYKLLGGFFHVICVFYIYYLRV